MHRQTGAEKLIGRITVRVNPDDELILRKAAELIGS